MKKFNLFLMCCFAAVIAKAQTPEMAKAIVHYKFTHVRDTTMRDKPYTENMVLFLGETSSAYKSFDKKTQDALMRKQLEQQIAEQKGNANMNFKITNNKPTTRSEIYQFPAVGKLMRKESLITPYLIEETMPAISWKITADTATHGTLKCQKATGHFRGRDYTAWFCPELPFRAGPWKLNGLPGLIVEAYDAKKEVEFKFDGLEQVDATKPVAKVADQPSPTGAFMKFNGDDEGDPNLISVPTNAVKTTEKEFNKLQDAMRKDPQAFMAAMGGGAGPGGNMVRSGGGAITGGPVRTVINVGPGLGGPQMNNPIELPEKK
ncbi:GLPGLI family protein [Mucilaginibacter terrenus]|uniref:GLPGLI family protein n=1 Tax=Mucilaginibacter terrenus TaxID=2482727 RepID=A0A3E2NQP0_9SPHI|nr:GLPGLI family protein [Mucilaginibacter terrenus]RFZ83293.1 GLPGLI family protein [Mucilaginibacter terrenus]